MDKQPGMVSFVGAGPGDPELLTLKGKRLIQEAALLLYAGSMIPPALLDLASPRASVIDAAPLDLEECHSLMLQFARAGQPVVHLHTGDPAVYSALREQLALLDRDGIPWQVVPGITAASAAAAAAGCSFTVPGATQSLIMTRMPGRTPMPPQEALRHLASHGTTLAVYLSAMQARAMLPRKPPIRIICPGRVYRADEVDATHSPVFHQMEGLVVDENVSMSDLRGTLGEFAKKLYGENTRLRFRPHHFPFTEPSAEMDCTCFKCGGKGCSLCKGEGFIEILGCGMVHPKVLEGCGIDSSVYSGFAFGIGLERITTMRYAIDDLRLLLEDDISFLEQF